MTVGQRIALKRKELNLSQEALGEQLGVSRQSIYKWESNAALPEIEKLIALSRLFGVTVGWLLGVEEDAPAEEAADTAPESGELTEAQLKMVEEIVSRYLAAQPPAVRKSPWGKWDVRILFAICGILLALLYGVNSKIGTLGSQYDTLRNEINRVSSSVNGQINGISSRVEEVLKSQNNLTAEYGTEIAAADLPGNTITFQARAVPKTYVQGMEAVFLADSGGGPAEFPGVLGPGQAFSCEITTELTDSITLSVAFLSPDGTRQTQLLDSYDNLYSASFPEADIMVYEDLFREVGDDGTVKLPELYCTVGSDSSAQAVNAAVGQAKTAGIRVGLFKNRELVTWGAACEKPANFNMAYLSDGGFYRFPQTEVRMSGDDTLCYAAIVTDEYGRESVWSDIPYIIGDQGEQSVLTWPDAADLSNHDPGLWTY